MFKISSAKLSFETHDDHDDDDDDLDQSLRRMAGAKAGGI
jgi:hypothetical protein